MKRLLGRRVAVAFVVVVAIAAAGIAYASIPDANGVIHGCYNSDNGALRVFGKSKDFQQCNAGEKPLDWSQTGPTGPTGATGTTGPTGPTGATGTLSSAYLDAYSSGIQAVFPGDPVSFDTVVTAADIIVGGLGTAFTMVASGIYQVTVDLQGNSFITAQLSVNGVGVGASLALDCVTLTCTFTRLLNVPAAGTISLVNANNISTGIVDTGSGITIVRIA